MGDDQTNTTKRLTELIQATVSERPSSVVNGFTLCALVLKTWVLGSKSDELAAINTVRKNYNLISYCLSENFRCKW